MRIAFILQIHKNPSQVNMFISQLVSEHQADVYVHIDKKNCDQMKGEMMQHPNVKILDQCIDCDWGDISQVDTTILLLKAVVESGQKYDYVCLRSGQDLLVKEGFSGFLAENKGKTFIKLREVNQQNLGLMHIKWPQITRKRYAWAHPVRMYRRFIQSTYRKGVNLFPNTNEWPEDYKFFNGSQWFTTPFEVATYMLNFIERNEWYYKYFKHTMCPDEWFFHTIIMNSHFKTNVINNNLMFMKWGEALGARNSPQYLTRSDIDRIENSNQFFARKFDENIDEKVVVYFANKICIRHSSIT